MTTNRSRPDADHTRAADVADAGGTPHVHSIALYAHLTSCLAELVNRAAQLAKSNAYPARRGRHRMLARYLALRLTRLIPEEGGQ
jgi:hypothetical protein